MNPPRCLLLALGLMLPLPLAAQEPVDFNRDIRPLLSDRCFHCHGFDAQQRRAGLRLDTWEGLTQEREGRHPVVPGKPAASELLRRVKAHDISDRMPPADSGVTVSAAEIVLLERWIAEGARFERHWAYVAPKASEPPDVASDITVRGDLDRFVAARLASKGLRPSVEADKVTLCRRVTLALTGLPPNPEEIDAFLADARPDAYGHLVDRLLASPRFGERMALMWLDVARYADTNGFHHDNIRTGWPYREWVIKAFNENMSYDQFVVEQLAGDLLENPTVSQRIATAFCRMHNINDEGGALDPEYRVEAVADRIETIATTFMGLTFTCSRCHDHKYDPFTQEDYYSLFAFFNSIEERGVYPANFEQAQAYPARILYRPDDLDAQVKAAEVDLEEARVKLSGSAGAILDEITAWEGEVRADRGVTWAKSRLVEVKTKHGTEVELVSDGSARAKGKRRPKETYTLVLQTEATDLRLVRVEALGDKTFAHGSVGLASNGNAVVNHVAVKAISVTDPSRTRDVEMAWAWADHEQPNGDFDVLNMLRPDAAGWAVEGHKRKGESRTALLLAKEPFGFDGGTRVEVTIACESIHLQHVIGRPRVSLGTAQKALDAFPVVPSNWFEAGPFTGNFNEAYDKAHGPGGATGVPTDPKVKWKHRPDIQDGVAKALGGARRAFYFGRALRTPVPRKLNLSLGSDDAIKVYLNGVEIHANKARRGVAPDQERVAIDLQAGENVLVIKIVNDGGPAGVYYRADAAAEHPTALGPAALIPKDMREGGLDERFSDAISIARSPTYAALSREVDKLEARVATLTKQTVPVLIMKELPKATDTYVLTRGSYATPDKSRPVKRRPPGALGGMLPEGAPNDRLGFARWLTDPQHPLVARVHVNRIWQTLFGTGIVQTTENFGHQSSWPSHLALLDWLSVAFVESGWDQKALIRRIVTSATYRQASRRRPDVAEVDPGNRLLSWFPRRRLEGELIRDQALYAAGLLVERIGGPSARPYQPNGLWREVSIGGSSNTQVFKRDAGEGLYRRSLYTFWKRTSPSPQMATFDAPTREFCVVRRGVTNTPLQALVLWNDEQFVEASRLLAQRDMNAAAMFRRCTGREPTARERTILDRAADRFMAGFAKAPQEAKKLLAIGESPLPKGHDPVKLATMTMVANTILSLDATIVLN
ncbi:MAG: PSD1 and planctomycete cytochrome C domain-containing protein [Planctomycetota bacterium]|nr:PSD1 and planctomycete cytochrome C domain-containing protein [Planctomycetota bacterium]